MAVLQTLLALATTARLPPTPFPMCTARLPLVARPFAPTMLCAPPPSPLTQLVEEALSYTGDEAEATRESLIETTVVSWIPSERGRLTDELADLLSQRAAAIQAVALAKHEAGEDYAEDTMALQTIVNIVVQAKLLAKKLEKASEEAAE